MNDDLKEPEDNVFLLVWDMNGLEAIVDIRDIDAADTMARLKNEPATALRSQLNYFILRARFNAHRHYEIYSIHTSKDVSEEDLRGMFEDDPQLAVDLIRKRGTILYSNRLSDRTIIR